MLKRLLLIALVVSLLFVVRPVSAQSSGPVYIVQPGDTLSSIAALFNVTVNDLMAANNISDPNLLPEGQRLVIPGLEGITGILDTEIVGFGDSFHSLVRRTQIPLDLLRRLNRVVSPTEFYVGASMVIPKQENATDLTNRITPGAGESLLELAVKANTNPWMLTTLNGLNGTWDGLPGDVLYTTGAAAPDQKASGLPSAFLSAEIPTLPFKQGGTGEIIVKPASGVTLSGMLVDYPLHFFPLGDGRMVALQGIHAMLDPGAYPLRLDATGADGSTESYEQMVLVASGGYGKEVLPVASELIDPAITGPEDQLVATITATATPSRLWQNKFITPIYLPADAQLASFLSDRFGTRRAFNGGDYKYFHSGLDFVSGFPDIYAAAPGIVVYVGTLNLRGNATFIDHGWGVYSAYYHQSQINVAVGQQVQAGQLIGQIGATGRVTGPHLHFEVWVDGIQVNPLDWLNNTYP